MNTNLRSASAHIKAYLKKEYPFLKTIVRGYQTKIGLNKHFEEVTVDIEDHGKLERSDLLDIRETLDKYQMGTYYEDIGIYDYKKDDDGTPSISSLPDIHRVRLFLREEVES